jgi:hypothetical protein
LLNVVPGVQVLLRLVEPRREAVALQPIVQIVRDLLAVAGAVGNEDAAVAGPQRQPEAHPDFGYDPLEALRVGAPGRRLDEGDWRRRLQMSGVDGDRNDERALLVGVAECRDVILRRLRQLPRTIHDDKKVIPFRALPPHRIRRRELRRGRQLVRCLQALRDPSADRLWPAFILAQYENHEALPATLPRL